MTIISGPLLFILIIRITDPKNFHLYKTISETVHSVEMEPGKSEYIESVFTQNIPIRTTHESIWKGQHSVYILMWVENFGSIIN